jgi:two-component system chemotaxis response regulator CheY
LPSARDAAKSGGILPGALLVGKNTSNQALGAVKHGMQTQTIQAVIADDDNVTRHLLRTLLRQHAIEVIGEACNGKEALQKCAALAPDLLFLDINMQEMGGFETLHALRQDMPGLAVIMISSDSTADNVKKALAQGAAGFVVKPFCPASVIEAVTRCTHKHA